MPKIILEPGTVMNLGGYVVENIAELPCIDVVVGNPLPEEVKIPAPVYSMDTLGEYRRMGLVIEFVGRNEMLGHVMDRVKKIVSERGVKE